MMEEGLLRVERELDAFLAVAKANHFLLYIPFAGRDLLELLSSCFHRRVTERIRARGYHEIAHFTERARQGKIIVLFSRILTDFDYGNSVALQRSGVFNEAFGLPPSTSLFSCYVVPSNTLLLQQDGFYVPGRVPLAQYGCETGAEWLATSQAIKHGRYDFNKKEICGDPLRHDCSWNRWCAILFGTFGTPDWAELFPPPWENPSLGVVDVYPYRVLNVLNSEFNDESTRESRGRPVNQNLASEAPRYKPRPSTPVSTKPWMEDLKITPFAMAYPSIDLLERETTTSSPRPTMESESKTAKPVSRNVQSFGDRTPIDSPDSKPLLFPSVDDHASPKTSKNHPLFEKSFLASLLSGIREPSIVVPGNEPSSFDPAPKGFVSLESGALKSIMGSTYKSSSHESKAQEAPGESSSESSYGSCTPTIRPTSDAEDLQAFDMCEPATAGKGVRAEAADEPVAGTQHNRSKKENARRKERKKQRKAMNVEKTETDD